ncbi:DUF6924 domain-containing protein [Nocardiopsis listeri]|uniref:DUF6924 domain-containing protein n=1 Tax=Nocardiopsis listeri TaxID=53440 RepID=UPI00083581E0|nr:hypothetical protein [Nocardiopsis listeri]
MRPPSPLFLPSFPAEEKITVFLVVRTAYDDQEAWQDTLSYLSDLPGVLAHPPLPQSEHDGREDVPPSNDQRLLLVDDPAWRNATTAEVHSALEQAGSELPHMVLLADERTMADPVHRPLLAFTTSSQDQDTPQEHPFVPHEHVLRIGVRQASMLYLVSDHGGHDLEEWKVTLPEEPDEVFGAELDLLASPPRYRPLTGRPPRLPVSEDPLLVRTHHGDDEAWKAVVKAVRAPVFDDEEFERPEEDPDLFYAYVHVVDDSGYTGLSFEQLMRLSPHDEHTFLIVADELTMLDPRHPLLVVDLWDQPGRSFRAVPGAIPSIQINLSLVNMDFDDFHCDEGFIQYWETEHEDGAEVL